MPIDVHFSPCFLCPCPFQLTRSWRNSMTCMYYLIIIFFSSFNIWKRIHIGLLGSAPQSGLAESRRHCFLSSLKKPKSQNLDCFHAEPKIDNHAIIKFRPTMFCLNIGKMLSPTVSIPWKRLHRFYHLQCRWEAHHPHRLTLHKTEPVCPFYSITIKLQHFPYVVHNIKTRDC